MKNQYLINSAIRLEDFQEEIKSNDFSAGGQALFLGIVRNDKIDNQIVKAIDYSAYEDMVSMEVERIKQMIFNEFADVKEILIFHSVGIVKIGEASLLVSILSGHRKQAFTALDKTVDLIKEHLPVWKKEIFEDESYRWIE